MECTFQSIFFIRFFTVQHPHCGSEFSNGLPLTLLA